MCLQVAGGGAGQYGDGWLRITLRLTATHLNIKTRGHRRQRGQRLVPGRARRTVRRAGRSQKVTPAGPGGAIYANDLFSYARGEATVFVPCAEPVRATGRISSLVVPEVELTVIVHTGAHTDADLAYGSLAAYVTDHALAVEGPIREYYVSGSS